ncbi:hypothetical protein M407DRAFT_25359 [Tulasnella calospora MUT 4182]|uniref:Glycoside hydrolase family 16 protein n=1 Tax=Tulasnella calospora MUT 4182 TaxID=1051891 RepID=A0A0C3LVF7_9AGAM|nr:hypothetical protein M407DRAFT_25359 [Tulasnella calospora MUT 4182]
MLLRLAAGLLAVASTAYAAHNITVLNNGTSIAYSGWKPFTNCGGTRYTFDLGQFFNFNFVGTGVFVVGTASLEGGIVTFNLDGVSTTFDRYSTPPYKCGVLLYGKGGLENTTHYLTATLSGPSPANATQSPFFEFQYLQFTQLDVGDSLTSSSLPTSGTVSATTTGTGAVPTQTGSSKVNAGAIGGGIAAGVIGLVIIGFVIWFCMRRNKQEKTAAAVATRPELDPPRQSFMYSPVGVSGYGRLSHEGPPGEGRRSMSAMPGSMNAMPGSMNAVPGSNSPATPWNPDAHIAANLAPQSDSSGTHYPPGAAAPSVIQSSSQSSGSSPVRTYSSGLPHSSASAYTVQNPGPGHHPGMMGVPTLPESDVERIAARVARMMHQPPQQPLPPQPQGGRPPKGGVPPPAPEAYDLPPPMYEPRQDP